MNFEDIEKLTKDNKMKYLVVEYTNSSFYGFNLVDKNERLAATKIVADVDNDFTITGWKMSKKNIMGFIVSGMAKLYQFWSKLS